MKQLFGIGVAMIAIAAAVWAASTPPDRGPGQGAVSSAPLGDMGLCTDYGGLPVGWRDKPHAGMVHIRGGTFQLGSKRGYAGERPLVSTKIESFWIDRTEVTNAQFATFIEATGYVTTAERDGGAAVFVQPDSPADLDGPGDWWQWMDGADWRHPHGPASDIVGKGNQPVVNVSLVDARAYAQWLGRQLPTEAQWEYAAKAGRGNAVSDAALRGPQGQPQANYWQGLFPYRNFDDDGFARRAPVGCFPPNPYGVYDMVGNVWEWTRDPWHRTHETFLRHPNPSRTENARVFVIKGGSFLCSANYCARARAASRQPAEARLSSVHIGFRTVSTSE